MQESNAVFVRKLAKKMEGDPFLQILVMAALEYYPKVVLKMTKETWDEQYGFLGKESMDGAAVKMTDLLNKHYA